MPSPFETPRDPDPDDELMRQLGESLGWSGPDAEYVRQTSDFANAAFGVTQVFRDMLPPDPFPESNRDLTESGPDS